MTAILYDCHIDLFVDDFMRNTCSNFGIGVYMLNVKY